MRVVEPRLSFNYTFDTERMTQLRGGVGLFQSNPPTVWATNPYQNNGMTTATYQVFNNCGFVPTGADEGQTCGTDRDGNPIPVGALPVFSADPFNQHLPPPANSQMTVDTVDPNFKLPSVWKFSLAFDRELPFWGVIGSAEYQHIDVRNGILYENINIGAPTGQLADGRNTYYQDPLSGSNVIDHTTNETVINAATGKPVSNRNRANANGAFSGSSTLLTNTHKGQADSLTLSLKKPFSESWFGSVGVTLGHSTEVNPGTSSQASSNFSNSAWVNPNQDVVSTSNYNVGRRVTAALTWQHKFFGDYATSVSAFYDGHNGQPYSWVFNNDANGDSYSGSDLVYIPTAGGDSKVAFAPGTSQAAIQQFWDFIKSDSYLSKHQGEIAKRNGTRAAWVNEVDLSFRQEIPGIFKGNKGEVRLDVYNFLNLLNSDWGQQSYVGFPYTRDLAGFAGVDSQGRMIYTLPTDKNGNYQPEQKTIYDAGRNTKTNVVSRWSAMLTVRYTF
jgi:hypothetical protein